MQLPAEAVIPAAFVLDVENVEPPAHNGAPLTWSHTSTDDMFEAHHADTVQAHSSPDLDAAAERLACPVQRTPLMISRSVSQAVHSAQRSVHARRRLALQPPPQTAANGFRAGIGDLTFQFFRRGVTDILAASKDVIVAAMRRIRERMKMRRKAIGSGAAGGGHRALRRTCHTGRRWRFTVTWLLGAVPLACSADWMGVTHAEAHAVTSGRAAQVANEDGYRLTIFMQDATTLVGVLQLPDGLEKLDERGCPTLSVDGTTPERLHDPAGRCQPNGRRARIRVADVGGREVDSQVLLQLLNGEVLTVRVRLTGTGYRETRFTLKGSKQALKSALPPGTVIVGD